MVAIELLSVTKRFGSQLAVNALNLSVPEASIYGFIGPNGSGKTTTLRMITRILQPDSGTIRVLGETEHGPANDRIAYLPEERGLYKQMKVRDLLRYYARLKNVEVTTPQIDSWLDRLGLAGHGSKRIGQLSKGMSQKVQFIATVIARPRLVLLDEPFSGLDPLNAVVLRDLVLDLKRQGVTVIFSTHDMSVAEQMCDSVFMIFRGDKVLDGSLQSIRRQFGEDTIQVRFDRPTTLGDNFPGASSNEASQEFKLRLPGDVDVKELLTRLMQRGTVERFERSTPTLQDIFVRVAGSDTAVIVE
jgi:ABC-2 type transport system ATP-binding protein